MQTEKYDEVLHQSASQGFSGISQISSGKWYQWSISSLVEKAGQNSGLVLELQSKLGMYPDWKNLIIVCFSTEPINWFHVADVSPKYGWWSATI